MKTLKEIIKKIIKEDNQPQTTLDVMLSFAWAYFISISLIIIVLLIYALYSVYVLDFWLGIFLTISFLLVVKVILKITDYIYGE